MLREKGLDHRERALQRKVGDSGSGNTVADATAATTTAPRTSALELSSSSIGISQELVRNLSSLKKQAKEVTKLTLESSSAARTTDDEEGRDDDSNDQPHPGHGPTTNIRSDNNPTSSSIREELGDDDDDNVTMSDEEVEVVPRNCTLGTALVAPRSSSSSSNSRSNHPKDGTTRKDTGNDNDGEEERHVKSDMVESLLLSLSPDQQGQGSPSTSQLVFVGDVIETTPSTSTSATSSNNDKNHHHPQDVAIEAISKAVTTVMSTSTAIVEELDLDVLPPTSDGHGVILLEPIPTEDGTTTSGSTSSVSVSGKSVGSSTTPPAIWTLDPNQLMGVDNNTKINEDGYVTELDENPIDLATGFVQNLFCAAMG